MGSFALHSACKRKLEMKRDTSGHAINYTHNGHEGDIIDCTEISRIRVEIVSKDMIRIAHVR